MPFTIYMCNFEKKQSQKPINLLGDGGEGVGPKYPTVRPCFQENVDPQNIGPGYSNDSTHHHEMVLISLGYAADLAAVPNGWENFVPNEA